MIDTCTTFVCYAHDNPARGYMFEDDGVRTHNVHSTAPGQGAYTPLSHAVPYEGRWFNYVGNYATALVVPLGTPATSYENCPIVRVHGLATGR